MTRLELEILRALRSAARPIGVLGLEDKCDHWSTPKQLRESLGYLVVEGYAYQVVDREHPEWIAYDVTARGLKAIGFGAGAPA